MLFLFKSIHDYLLKIEHHDLKEILTSIFSHSSCTKVFSLLTSTKQPEEKLSRHPDQDQSDLMEEVEDHNNKHLVQHFFENKSPADIEEGSKVFESQ